MYDVRCTMLKKYFKSNHIVRRTSNIVHNMNITNLESELERYKKNLGANKKYYHLNSIGNFFFHFDNLRDDESKQFVIDSLTACFAYYEEHRIDNISDSMKTFQQYLIPVGKIYQKQLGFFVFTKPPMMLLLITSGYSISYFVFKNNLIFFTTYTILVLAFIGYSGFKFSQRKLYAFCW
jgi:hypothetical protein